MRRRGMCWDRGGGSSELRGWELEKWWLYMIEERVGEGNACRVGISGRFACFRGHRMFGRVMVEDDLRSTRLM